MVTHSELKTQKPKKKKIQINKHSHRSSENLSRKTKKVI